MTESRIGKIIWRSIKKFNLDLEGLNVLTEAASGAYAFTPIIAALAGANAVYAYAEDSKYGKKQDIKSQLMALAAGFQVQGRIHVVLEKSPEIIGECDIITNSGFVRPIDRKMIDAMKTTAAIPLMYEAWEYRNKEIDVEYCKERGIPVLGTNENREGADVFDCLGFLVSKLLLECGLEIFGNNILILGDNKIARALQMFFNRNLVKNTLVTFNEDRHAPHLGIIYYKLFDNLASTQEYDAVLFSELLNDVLLLGKDGVINAMNIDQFKDTQFIHVCGKVDPDFIKDKAIRIYPEVIAPLEYMSISGDYLGPAIPIQLTTAGLKVGEIMARLKREGKTYDDVIKIASRNPLVSNFSNEIEMEERRKNLSNPGLLDELRRLHYELRDFTKKKYNRINPFSEDLFSWEEKGSFWAGKNVVIYDSAAIVGDVEIGDNTWVGPYCDLDGTGKLKIGDFCTIAAGTQILTHDTVRYYLSGGKCEYEHAPTTIGSYCFIGAHSIILKGSSIGNHCLVSANSLVNKSFEDFSIIAGVPAKKIGIVKLVDNKVELEFFEA